VIVSHHAFIWFCTIMTVGLAGTWVFVDLWRLRNVVREDLSRPVVRDRLFGSLIGLAVSVAGILGMLRYHL
jgi:hypothetical protein